MFVTIFLDIMKIRREKSLLTLSLPNISDIIKIKMA